MVHNKKSQRQTDQGKLNVRHHARRRLAADAQMQEAAK